MNLRFWLLWSSIAGVLSVCGCTTIATPLALTPPQRNEVEKAQTYLNSLAIFQAHFTQIGASGPGAGVLWVARPGRLRLTYFGPNAQDMVANGATFVIYNHATGATTTMPVARTPLGLLLAARISLSGTVAVTGFVDSRDRLSLTLQDSLHPEQGTLELDLQKSPTVLVGVTATDLHGRSLSLTLTDLDTRPIITPDLFRYPGNIPTS